VPAWLLARRPEGGPRPARPEHVILVDWDGFDPDYLGRAPTPNIAALASRGSLSTAERTFTTKSNPTRASLSTGAFVVEAKTPWGFGSPVPEEWAPRGGHGSTLEMRVPLLIAGAGFRTGVVPRKPGLVDVAPTIAALLGARPPADAQGRALDELLNE
jgi:arylsulfatase A-like enzyme